MDKLIENTIAGIILIGIILGIGWFMSLAIPRGRFECMRYKNVVSVRAIPHSGTFGGGVDYLTKYDDGSYDSSGSVLTDKKVCANWEWKGI